MSAPFFFLENISQSDDILTLDEDSSRHVSVLRMNKGEKVQVTDGKGIFLDCSITDPHKKHCKLRVDQRSKKARGKREVTIAISLLKNAVRFEWFLEKATELGINTIIPLICSHTEKQKFRLDRMRNLMVSAMLQSQQAWLPDLHQPIPLDQFFSEKSFISSTQKFIAHCLPQTKRNLADLVNDTVPSQIILIGPEGDFSPAEIDLAIENHFDAVALGETRLRAETAGVVAATILRLA
jgi:16S rRNA (uracil1498-N3)-methyltransferase